MALGNADWEVFVGRTSLVEPGRRSKLHLTLKVLWYYHLLKSHFNVLNF